MVFLSFAPFVNAEQVDVWFGTTATKQGLSKGIYHANFDTDTGELSQPTLAVEADSPGFLAMHPNGKMLYAAARESGKDVVVAYKIKKTNEQVTLTKVNSIAIGDGKAVHLSVDRSGKFLLTAQYRGGSTALFDLADDAALFLDDNCSSTKAVPASSKNGKTNLMLTGWGHHLTTSTCSFPISVWTKL